MSILAWRDALAVRCISRLFPADKRGDWPDCLTPGQAAALQRPYVGDDTQGRRQMNALASVIEEACLSGALPCGEEVKVISPPAPPVQEKNHFASAEWLSEFSPQSIASPQLNKKTKEHREYFIKPVDLLAWFNSCELVPTQHLAAWFKAQGVALATAGDAAPVALATAGDAAPVALLDSDGMMTPAALVQWRKQADADPSKKSKPWPKPNVQALAAWLRRECAENGQRGALTRIAKQFGYDRPQSLRALLKRHGFKPVTGKEVPPPSAESAWNGYGDKSRKVGT